MLRYVFAFALAFLPAAAFGQANVCLNASGGVCGAALTGTAISATGYNPSVGGGLFVLPAASLQSGSLLTLSYDVKTTAFLTATSSLLVDSRPSGSNSTGFLSYLSFFENNDFIYMFEANPAGFSHSSSYCRDNNGHTCVRVSLVNDGNWHHVCSVFAGPSNTFTMVDGVLRDFNDGSEAFSPALGFTPSTSFWSIGFTGVNNFNIREMQSKQAASSQSDCATLYQYHLQNKRPSTGPLSVGWSIWLPFDNCNGSGCADISGNSNNAVYDSTPPTVVVTAPTNGQTGISGSFNITGTCTDAVGISLIRVFVDGLEIGSATATPFSVAWATTPGYVDGAHSINATCLNAGNVYGTSSTVTASTSNSISAKTVYMDPTSGTDCPTNTGLSTGSPCSTWAGVMAIINSNPLHGGDSILQQHGTNLNITDMTNASVLTLAGGDCTVALCGYNQNVYPGLPITIGTYGGSGNCHVLSAVTTDCASTTFSTNGAVTQWNSIINVFNTPNVVIQNHRLFGSQTNATLCVAGFTGNNECGGGIRYVGANNSLANATPFNTGTIQNVEVTDFFTPLYVSSLSTQQFASFGEVCGITVQDNYLHGSSIAAQIGNAFLGQSLYVCGPATVGLTLVSNYTNDIGGNPTNVDGSGIQIESSTPANNIVDNFNVTINGGYNNTSCGGPYGNWWYAVNGTNTVKGNEAGFYYPHAVGGCDKGAFDLDFGTGGFTLNYNYGHDTDGPSVNLLIGSVGTDVSGPFVQAYNIFENPTANQLVATGSGVGSNNIYNNSLWNGNNGVVVPPRSTPGSAPNVNTEACVASTSYLANNISVSNSVNFAAIAYFVEGNGTNVKNCWGVKMLVQTNDWYNIGTNPSSIWRYIGGFGVNYSTVTTWNTAVGANDVGTNPNLSVGSGGVQCYTALSGVPVQPGSITCPTNYQLTTGNGLIGTGTSVASLGITGVPGFDYFTNTIPNGVGTGWNIGTDGAHH